MTHTDQCLSATQNAIERSMAHLAKLSASVAEMEEAIRSSRAALAPRNPRRIVAPALSSADAKIQIASRVVALLREHGYRVEADYRVTLH